MIWSLSFQARTFRRMRNSERVRFKNSSAASMEVYSCIASGTDIQFQSRNTRKVESSAPLFFSVFRVFRGFYPSSQSGKFLEQVPVFEPLLLGPEQRFRRIAVLIKMFGKAPFATGKVDE
jgi:hypothetical protein